MSEPEATFYPTTTGFFALLGPLFILVIVITVMIIVAIRRSQRPKQTLVCHVESKKDSDPMENPWYSLDGMVERLFGQLRFCKKRIITKEACGTGKTRCKVCTDSDELYDKGCDNVFKLIETIKLVVVFLMGAFSLRFAQDGGTLVLQLPN
jgi:hypothetical protein